MTWGASLTTALIALILASVTTPVVIRWASRRGIVDRPNHRSSHHLPTPRGGGVAIALGAIGGAALPGMWGPEDRLTLMTTGLLFGVLGLADDVRGGLSPRTRLALQLVAGLLALPLLQHGMTGPTLWWKSLFAAGTILWLVSYVNAFNFMDGINGIASVQAVVAGVAWMLIGHANDLPALTSAGAVAAGAALGFAPFNFPRARVFLGDAGSYFLGAWMAVAVVFGLKGGLAPESVLAPLSIYLSDTALTIVRRARRGECWYEAHREHTYQQLVAHGWSHLQATLVVGGFIAACSVAGALALLGSLGVRVVGDVALAALVGLYAALPSFLARQRCSAATPSARV